MFMSVACGRECMKEAKRLLPSLKEALDTIKPKLHNTGTFFAYNSFVLLSEEKIFGS